jgi:hypothetical protein
MLKKQKFYVSQAIFKTTVAQCQDQDLNSMD